MLDCSYHSDNARVYRIPCEGQLEQYVATTPETRAICNDPKVAGIDYTDKLQAACAAILQTLDLDATEDRSVVVNILRGGLNYGLRHALRDAYGWNNHTTCFISAQRARNSAQSEDWHITENAYRKVYLPKEVSLFIGDVVATGTSLRYALNELITTAQESHCALKDLVFFTIGGFNAATILAEIDKECRRLFCSYQRTVLIFIEGCFSVPTPETKLSIRLTGTDLIRTGAIMAPEFIESQYECASYPIERCTIYDAGSRAFFVREYAADVQQYWMQVLNLADRGVTYADYLAERFPELDAARFGSQSLREIAIGQINAMGHFLN